MKNKEISKCVSVAVKATERQLQRGREQGQHRHPTNRSVPEAFCTSFKVAEGWREDFARFHVRALPFLKELHDVRNVLEGSNARIPSFRVLGDAPAFFIVVPHPAQHARGVRRIVERDVVHKGTEQSFEEPSFHARSRHHHDRILLEQPLQVRRNVIPRKAEHVLVFEHLLPFHRFRQLTRIRDPIGPVLNDFAESNVEVSVHRVHVRTTQA